MENLPDLIKHVQSYPESTRSLLELIDIFLDRTTSVAERQAIRQAAGVPDVTLAFENLYFDGVGMNQPEAFVRQTIATLFMTGGFRDRDTAQQIVGELRVFADHHGVDFDRQHEMIRALPGVQRAPRRVRRFLLMNAALFVMLIVGTVVVQTLPDPVRIGAQLVVLLAVIGTQMAVLYRFYRL